MRGNVFTSYIICNRLNLETFFEPIIDFIEIGKPRGLPLRELYMRISSHTAQTKIPQNGLKEIWDKKRNQKIPSSLKIRKGKSKKALCLLYFFVLIIIRTKKSSRRTCLYVDRSRPLESSIYLFLFLSFVIFICM